MGDIHYMTTEDEIEDVRLQECIEKLSLAGVSDEELKEMIPQLLEAKELKIRVRGSAVAEDVECVACKEDDPCTSVQIKDYLKDAHENSSAITYTPEMARVDVAITMERVLQNNNIVLERGICDVVTESIKKEMTYLLLAKDQVEEERYKRLDTLIRQQQVSRKETGKKTTGWFSRGRVGFTG